MDGTGGTIYYLSEPEGCAHSYEEQIVEPTCTEGGYSTFVCTLCGHRYDNNFTDPVGHAYTEEIKAATCTENGYTTYTCTLCADTYTGEPTDALDHEWDEGIVTVAPTATEEGELLYACLRCEETKTELIPATGEEEPKGCPYGDSCGSQIFTDMPEFENWAHEGIDFVIARGLFNGMSKDTFAPSKAMTRGMLVTVLWRSVGEPEATVSDFKDVPHDTWYSKAVAWAAEQGVVNGMGDGTFRPDNLITREQLATILYRFAKLTEMDPPERADLSGFPDGEAVQSYAVEALQWAVAKGLINGVYNSSAGQTFLRPDGSATRGQVATILMRFIQG